jgi:hypothetical protein
MNCSRPNRCAHQLGHRIDVEGFPIRPAATCAFISSFIRQATGMPAVAAAAAATSDAATVGAAPDAAAAAVATAGSHTTAACLTQARWYLPISHLPRLHLPSSHLPSSHLPSGRRRAAAGCAARLVASGGTAVQPVSIGA